MRKTIILFVLCLGVCGSASAQSPSKEDQEKLKKIALRYIGDVQSLLKMMVGSKDKAQKDNCATTALYYFLDDATMEVANLKSAKKKLPMKDYLERVKGYNERYAVVLIDFKSTGPVTDLKFAGIDSKGDSLFKGTYSFIQKFCASTAPRINDVEHKPNYEICDNTKKSGEIIASKRMTITGQKWVVKLGDIKVDAISGP